MPRIRLFFMSMIVGRAGAGGDRDVIEAELPRVLDRQRAAEADAAVDPQLVAPRQRQVQQRQEVLVPAHGDAVLGHAAEAFEHALVERPVDLAPVADRPRRPRRRRRSASSGSGSIFSPSIADHAEAFVQQVVRQRVAGRAEADDEHVLAVVRQRVRAGGR